ncbi:MAG: DsbA family protein [Deltaproteobacteria bacterium]|nr:DsbA family protein [Deltaproteobacteria bacterium]
MKTSNIIIFINLLITLSCQQVEPIGECVLSIASDSPTRGPEDAWVTMVEFSDFQCSYCREANNTIKELLDTYPDDLRLVFRHFPLPQHKFAYNAAIAAQCAQPQNRFWEMAAILFAHQSALSNDDLASYAQQAELDIDLWNQCFTERQSFSRISADKNDATMALVSATPTFFINGKRLVGSLPLAEFKTEIDKAIAIASTSGASRDEYYPMLLNKGCKVEQP